MYPICRLKNISGEVKNLHLKTFDIDEVFTIQDSDRMSWAGNDDTLIDIANENIEVHDVNGAIEGISTQIDHLKGY